eukprot:Hpha_TRINITY_DN3064_c0_g1::TRINITY_DN3064_c0_g1_i1::g.138713::m.138713
MTAGSRVYVNVYDIAPSWVNSVLGGAGFGIFHTGVQVYGHELGFGRAASECCGVYCIAPRSYTQHTFRESVYVGTTTLSEGDVVALRARFERTWGKAYHLINRNCNSFAEAFVHHLLRDADRVPFPSGVNRLCRAGQWLLPEVMVEEINEVDNRLFERWCREQRAMLQEKTAAQRAGESDDEDEQGSDWRECEDIAEQHC